MLGSANGHTEIVRALLEHENIDVSIRNNALTRVYGDVSCTSIEVSLSPLYLRVIAIFAHLVSQASQNAEEMACNSAIKELFRQYGT